MALVFRDVHEHELDAVLALNNAAGRSIVPIDAGALRELFDIAAYFRVAEIDGHMAAFLIALTPEAPYGSVNFRWFRERYESFVYIDRIVVAERYRRHGLGRLFYADVTSYAEVRVPFLTCEVFLDPPDDVSVLFHGTYGFQEVGQQLAYGRRVALLAKELCSFPWVEATYLKGGNGHLPALPWLAERPQRPQQLAQAAGGN
jgi:predicted GNAT superfamily acetyltransferase